MITLELISSLCCPICKASGLSTHTASCDGQRLVSGELRCTACDGKYPIRDGLADFIPRHRLTSAGWQLWLDHLGGLEARRAFRNERPTSLTTKATNQTSRLQQAFAEFTGIRNGTVLDVGCGPGNFRRHLDPAEVQYFGIDPLPLESTRDFPFAKAIAEFIPFRNGLFSDVVVMSALDHFYDLDAFFREVARVLQPAGKLHIVQSIHEVRGPITAIKTVSHWMKDHWENSATRSKNQQAPKHMAEYSKSAVHRAVERHFRVVAERAFSKRWYSPTKIFLSMEVLPRGETQTSDSTRPLVLSA
jgi:SAM-dependent methyltransferase